MDYPFTKEELTAMIDKLWEDNENKIDYQAISDIYRHNGWTWGGHLEPMYIPEYRDIKQAIKQMYKECGEMFVRQFFVEQCEFDPDTESNNVSIQTGRLLCTMSWDDDPDCNNFVSFSVSINTELVLLCYDGCVNCEIDDDDNE